MSKGIALFIVFALLIGAIPTAFAQDDGIPACTEEEKAAGIEILSATHAAFLELGEISADISLDSYRVLLPAYEALSYTFWDETFGELPFCAEIYFTAYTFGAVYDEALNIVALRWQALYEDELGDPEMAQIFAASSESRNADLSEAVANIDVIAGYLATVALGDPACTEEQITAFSEAWESTATSYEALGVITADADLEDLGALVVGYDLLAQDWDETLGEIGLCYEILSPALDTSTVLGDSLTVVSLFRIAVLESEYGDADVATILSNAAVARLVVLQATVEGMMAEE